MPDDDDDDDDDDASFLVCVCSTLFNVVSRFVVFDFVRVSQSAVMSYGLCEMVLWHVQVVALRLMGNT